MDKCQSNCKTCEEGGDEENNNCLTCPTEGTKYFEFGNCKGECVNGVFTEDSILKCKCSYNSSCEKCEKESDGIYLCITCNNEDGYYKKNGEESNNGFINCYNNLEGYYLDSENKIYKPCYNSCRTCEETGTEIDNKCLECKEDYQTKNDFENDNNCYKICDYKYYYDSNNKYHCTEDDNCPTEISKLIPEKNRCVDNCNNLNLIEHNNECISDCPSGYYNKDNKCIEDLNCESKNKFYNYEKTECIDSVPIGYYCNNKTLKTIDKCHNNCKTCEQGGTDDNNNCLTCKDEGTIYYDLGNCKNICPNGNFIEENINKCKCSQNKTCKLCSEESNRNNLCITCNTENEFYPKINDDANINSFINCYNDTTILISCNYYYYLNKSTYYCTNNNSCPQDFKFLIREKNKCTNDCSKDNKYKFQYENVCYTSCPSNTKNSKENKYICEYCIDGECGSGNLDNKLNNLIEDFPAENISCDNNHVSFEEDENYKIYLYKNNNCSEQPENHPIIDFGECYKLIKAINSIDEDLIVTKVTNKHNDSSAYSFYHPNTLNKLDSTPCENKSIIESKNIEQKISDIEDSKELLIRKLIEQGINVFNMSDNFYTDICFHYESPNGKDVPIKARLSAFFPNITLCETGCENIGVDLKSMKAKCECKFIDIVNMDKYGDNLYINTFKEILDIISELNIAVIKCIKDIFKAKYFVKNTGGFIIITLFIGQVGCFIKYAIDGLYFIRKYLFDLTTSYINYIGSNKSKLNVNIPPKKKKLKRKSMANLNNISSNQSKNILENSNHYSKKKMIDMIESSEKNSSNSSYKNNLLFSNKPKFRLSKLNTSRKKSAALIYKKQKNDPRRNLLTNSNKKNNNIIINMKEYLSASFDENDFDDVIEKEKRSILTYFCEKFKINQIFINTFLIKEPLRPRSLKILVLIMTIELYFVINALFYNEDYLSDLFHSTKKEKFFSFIPRRYNEIIYTSAVSEIISYFVGYVFVEEEKIKKIFRKNKEGDIKMKYEISLIVKDIQNKFTTIIVISIVLTVVCFIYISCFNNVYPYIKNEWIKSSLFILILMQFINFARTLIECLLRYCAIKVNSERLFKLSQVFAL